MVPVYYSEGTQYLDDAQKSCVDELLQEWEYHDNEIQNVKSVVDVVEESDCSYFDEGFDKKYDGYYQISLFEYFKSFITPVS